MAIVDLATTDQFHCIHSNCARKTRSCPRCSREPSRVSLKELTRAFKMSRKLRQLTREHMETKTEILRQYLLVNLVHTLPTSL